MFKSPKNSSIPEMEERVLKFWQKQKIFEKSVQTRPADNLYVFYDGPPFISGLPHYGHLLSSIAKDVIPRYWTMRGKRVERLWGWDAHGLTVENQVQKRLGIKNRRDIEKFGLERFTEECYNYTSEVSAEWEWYIDKIARWVDMKNAYKTIDQDYMESVIWVFKQMFDKDLIYEGVYTSLFCTTCGTPVSNFEIAMDNTYREVEDPSITVKFLVTTRGKYQGVNILAWTTTPWTIPSNRGLVVDPEENYLVILADGEKYLLAEKRLSYVFAGRDHKVEKKLKGKELLGLEYQPPYLFYKPTPQDFKVYEFEDMVHMEEGTGVVHSAPGFGEIDTAMGYHYGLRVMLTLDDEGKFISGDAGKNPFESLFYADANPEITQDLNERKLLFKDEKIRHRYPYHDRCNTWLIQKAQNSWFVNIQKLKKDMLRNNEHINWVPEHLKYGRFKHVIETAPDWCISRARFWATPMPIWRNEDGDTIVVDSIKELEDLSGQKVKDLHRPYIDEVIINKDGKEYRRVTEVLDSWFEAGSMPYGQFHYPFENVEKFEENFPGNYVTEYIAQVRAWFNVMHRISTALFNSHPFKNVVTTGVMAGSDGRKMSKTYQNYTDPKEVLETIGGDSLRLYLMNSPLMLGDNANFDDKELRNKLRNVINPLWNSLIFFLIYANYHKWKPKHKGKMPKSDHILDQWIITRLQETIQGFSENIEKYLIPQAIQPIEDFIDDLSRWYVRRSREKIANCDQEALETFYYVLLEIAKAAAPIIPFISEEIYQNLRDEQDEESVHLESYPNYDAALLEENRHLIDEMDMARQIVSAALSVRVVNKIPVRQPLKIIYITDKFKIKEEYWEIIKEETNVKEIEYVKSVQKYPVNTRDLSNMVSLAIEIDEELKYEGLAREMVRKFQDLRKKNKLNIKDHITAYYPDSEENQKIVSRFEKDIKEKILADSLVPGSKYRVSKK